MHCTTLLPNCFIISDTPRHDIEETFRGFLKRDDIAIILINQTVSTCTQRNQVRFQCLFLYSHWHIKALNVAHLCGHTRECLKHGI